MSKIYIETTNFFGTILFCYINKNIGYIIGKPELEENYNSEILSNYDKLLIKNRIDNNIDMNYVVRVGEVFTNVYKNIIRIHIDNFNNLRENYDTYDFVYFPIIGHSKDANIEVYYSDNIQEEILTQLLLCRV